MIIESLINGFDMIMEMLQSGGVITYIILLLGIYGLLISIRKIFTLATVILRPLHLKKHFTHLAMVFHIPHLIFQAQPPWLTAK